MTTSFITHPDCLKHDMGDYHPEAPVRLSAIYKEVEARGDRLASRLLTTGLTLIAAACFGLFLALVGYRWVAIRMERR